MGGEHVQITSNLTAKENYSLAMAHDLAFDPKAFAGFTPANNEARGEFSITLDGVYQIDGFALWNDINANGEGVKNYSLRFYDEFNNLLTERTGAGTPGDPNSLNDKGFTLQQFDGLIDSVAKIEFIVLDSFTQIEIRELGFTGKKIRGVNFPASFIGYPHIRPATNLSVVEPYLLNQLADGILYETSANPAVVFNGFTSNESEGDIELYLDKAYTLSEFVLWNDINVQAEGISKFKLLFWDANGEPLGETASTNVSENQRNEGRFGFRPVSGVSRVTLQVLASHNISGYHRIEIRELGFIGVADKPDITITNETRSAQGITITGQVDWGQGNRYQRVQAQLGGEPLNLFDHGLQFVEAQGAPWDKALARAQQLLGNNWHPATITSAAELNNVSSLLDANQRYGDVYLGAYLDRGDNIQPYSAHWINGEPWGYTAWGNSDGVPEPNDTGNNHYLTLRRGSSGWAWNDLNLQFDLGNVQGILMEQSAPSVTLTDTAATTVFQLFIPNSYIHSDSLSLAFTDSAGRTNKIAYKLKNSSASTGVVLDAGTDFFSRDNFALRGSLNGTVTGLKLRVNNSALPMSEYKIINQPLVSIDGVVPPEGWHLATITSAAEHQYLIRLLNASIQANQVVIGSSDQYYIGGRRNDGLWYWNTQELFNYQGWAPGEPSGDGPALVLSGRQNWLWNDLPQLDANSQGYILERNAAAASIVEDAFDLVIPGGSLTAGLNQVWLETVNAAGIPVNEPIYLTYAPD